MAKYWISFRIKDDATYQRRYSDLIDAINKHVDGKVWEPDTSMVAIESGDDIDTVGASLKAALNSTTDHLVIRQIDYISTRYINDPGAGFFAFFPKAIKL